MSVRHVSIRRAGWFGLIAMPIVSACLGDANDQTAEVASAVDALTVDSETTWRLFGFDDVQLVSVCFENPDTTNRSIIQSAVQNSWQAVANINFIGWTTCGSNVAAIRIGDTAPMGRPLAKALGRHISNQSDGIMLDRTSTDLNYLTYSAIHEFGHALGFGHEQDRADISNDCRNSLFYEDIGQVAPDLELSLNPDPNSVMNYCASPLPTTLSAGDIEGVQRYYGSRGGTNGIEFRDVVGLQSHDGRYLSVDTNGSPGGMWHLREFEKFEVIDPDGGSTGALNYGAFVALRDFRGTFLSARTDLGVGTASERKSYERWQLVDPRQPGSRGPIDVNAPVGFRSVHDGFLSNEDGALSQKPWLREFEVWRFKGEFN